MRRSHLACSSMRVQSILRSALKLVSTIFEALRHPSRFDEHSAREMKREEATRMVETAPPTNEAKPTIMVSKAAPSTAIFFSFQIIEDLTDQVFQGIVRTPVEKFLGAEHVGQARGRNPQSGEQLRKGKELAPGSFLRKLIAKLCCPFEDPADGNAQHGDLILEASFDLAEVLDFEVLELSAVEAVAHGVSVSRLATAFRLPFGF